MMKKLLVVFAAILGLSATAKANDFWGFHCDTDGSIMKRYVQRPKAYWGEWQAFVCTEGRWQRVHKYYVTPGYTQSNSAAEQYLDDAAHGGGNHGN